MSNIVYKGEENGFYRFDFVEDDGTISGYVLSDQAPEDN